MFSKIIQRKKTQQGFNLLGVIIAIFIVAVGLTAIVNMVNSAIRAAYSTQNKIIASGLAQEGIEAVRSMRGNSSDWDAWFSGMSAGDYRVQYDSTSLMAYSDTFLLFGSSTGLYQYSTGTSTIFKRKISITIADANEVRFRSIITWVERGIAKTLEVEDILWNWR